MIDLAKTKSRWTVTLNRPDKANALSLEMLNTLADIAVEARQNTDLKVLVLTGAGERVFSAGADLAEAQSGASMTRDPVWERLSGAVAAFPCLTIAALNGTLAGGGFGMALACDLRVAVPTAKFFYPVLKNGFLPQPSDVMRMVALIGPARTQLILLAGQKLTAKEALAIGLIDRIAERDDLSETLDALSADALSAEPHNLTAIKRLCDGSVNPATLRDCYAAVYEDDKAAKSRLR